MEFSIRTMRLTRARIGLVALVVLAATGCASSSKTYLADGRPGYALNCSGTARNWGMCEQKAGELCGSSGYDVATRSSDQGFIAAGSSNGFSAGSTISRTMTIACKQP